MSSVELMDACPRHEMPRWTSGGVMEDDLDDLAVIFYCISKIRRQRSTQNTDSGSIISYYVQNMLQLGVYNNIVMEFAMDGDKFHDLCMSGEQFEEVLTFVVQVITSKTGKVPAYDVI